MKKLLLVLLVVALASFLFVGCIPSVTPDEDEGEVGICPTVSITSEVEIAGKKYIKGATQTITVTFAEATEQVAVYVGSAIKSTPVGVPDEAAELVMYTTDNKVYTGTYRFNGTVPTDCDEDYVYVTTCAICAPCKFAYTVDDAGPCSEILIREYPTTGCDCGGVNINFVTQQTAVCDTCCGDYCTGLDTATFDLYKADPFGTCCDIPCISPIATCTSVDCDINCTISCFDISAYTTATAKDFYLVTTLADKVGNKTYYYAILNIDTDDVVSVTEYINGTGYTNCTDWSAAELAVVGTANVIGACADADGVCGHVDAIAE